MSDNYSAMPRAPKKVFGRWLYILNLSLLVCLELIKWYHSEYSLLLWIKPKTKVLALAQA